MKFKICFFLSVLCSVHFAATAQNYFTAIIKDSITNKALPGATVIEQGTNNIATADSAGAIHLAVSKTGDVLFTIQYVGYSSKNVIVAIPQKESPLTILLVANNEDLGEVTVTSVRTNSRIEDIPTRVEVLGTDDLVDENSVKPGNIMSLLGDIAGIQLQQVSASSGNTYARIQGLNGRYTQILKDGMPLFGGLSGNFGILQIPPLDLKQIEIIKGSASTLYGGDAIGGIINLVSKVPTNERELSLTANQTTLRETNLNAYYGQRFKKIGITLFAGETLQKQGDIDKDGLSDVPNVSSTVIHPKLFFYFNPRSTLTLDYTGSFDNRKGGDMRYFSNTANDTLYHVNSNINRNSADAKWLYEFSKTKNLTAKFSTSYFTQDLNSKFYTFNATQLIYYSEISYFQKTKNMDWVAGINFNGDIFNNKTASLPAIYDYNYQTFGVFIQNTWKPFEKLTIESGFRNDYHSKYGFFPLPRLSFLYKFNRQFTARINGGFGYKVPNLITYIDPETDLNIITANTNLRSELSQGINADINFHKLFFDKLNVTINQSFFFTNITHPVYDSSISTNHIFLANANDGLQTKGLQTYARIKYDAVELYLGYVYTHVLQLYKTQNRDMPVTPKHNFAATLVYEPKESWRCGIESSLVAGQLDENYEPVKNYVLFAAMVQYNIGKLSFVLNGENLLDFRQNKYGKIYDGTISNPVFHKLWAPIDGRVINLSVKWTL